MSAMRSTFIRAVTKAGRRTAPSIIARSAVRAFTTTPSANDYEQISEKEIPATKFQPGMLHQFILLASIIQIHVEDSKFGFSSWSFVNFVPLFHRVSFSGSQSNTDSQMLQVLVLRESLFQWRKQPQQPSHLRKSSMLLLL